MSAAEFEGVLRDVNAILHQWSGQKGVIRILEAGGGAFTYLDLPRTHVTTIDISEAQIAKNDYADVKIVGDLHKHRFAPQSFDLIVCFDVLEHLAHPAIVVDSLLNALKPDGVLYIASPYNRSIAGLIAKFTPHWFHVFCYRYLFGPNPTDPHKERIHEFVFPTYMRRAMNPYRLQRHGQQRNTKIAYFALYSRDKREHLYAVHKLIGLSYDAVTWTARALTLFRAHPECTDYILLLKQSATVHSLRNVAMQQSAA